MKRGLTDINLKDTSKEEIKKNLISSKNYATIKNLALYYVMEDEYCQKSSFKGGDAAHAMFCVMGESYLWNYEEGFMSVTLDQLVNKLWKIIGKYY